MKPFCVWLTGLSAAGKTSIAEELFKSLKVSGVNVALIDGDDFRAVFASELGYSEEDREENQVRMGSLALLYAEVGVSTVVASISPCKATRAAIRKVYEEKGFRFVEVFVDTPLEECERRDPKGLYKSARAGEFTNMTGLDGKYDRPENPECTVNWMESENYSPDIYAADLMRGLYTYEVLAYPKPRSLFIGRWQPFHNGHYMMIRVRLDAGESVAIGVRDTIISPENPFPLDYRIKMIEAVYEGQDVEVFRVPDIDKVIYGREVGYTIINQDMNPVVEAISATEIRESLFNKDERWKEMVPSQLIPFLSQT